MALAVVGAVLVLGVAVLGHLYVAKRLIGDTLVRRGPRVVATLAFLAITATLLVTLFLGTTIDPEIARWFAWPGYLWMAIGFYLIIALAVLELPRLALRRWVRAGSAAYADHAEGPGAAPAPTRLATSPSTNPDRRMVLARASALVAGLTAVTLVGYGNRVAMGAPDVIRSSITLPWLDPRASGLRIALVADLHLGPILGREFTESVVDLINSESVDLVAIAGDVADGSVEHLADAVAPLAALHSTHGTFFVTGNHEYYGGHSDWVEHLHSLGITILRNEHVPIEHNGGGVDLAGVNDPTGEQYDEPPDVAAAVSERDPSTALVLLAHQPAALDDAVRHDVDLLLTGHTHGGQIAPFHLAVYADNGTLHGWSEHGRTQMFVTRGAGFWGPPVRVGAPPDISILELRSDPDRV